MLWPKRFSPRVDRLTELVDKVKQYIENKLAEGADDDFYPQVISSAISESYLAVLTALGILDEEGLVAAKYGVFCSADNTLIAEAGSLQDAREIEDECTLCEVVCGHSDETAYIDLYFVAKREEFLRLKAKAA